MQIPDPVPCRLDDDGFLVLVDPTAYAGFVDEEWTMDTLQAHVVDQGGRGRITGAYLGPFLQGLPAEVRSDRSVRPSTREAVAGVEVQGDGLYVVDYTALTMAAQFSGRDVVQDRRTSDRVLLPAGWYRVRHPPASRRGRRADPSMITVTVPQRRPCGTVTGPVP